MISTFLRGSLLGSTVLTSLASIGHAAVRPPAVSVAQGAIGRPVKLGATADEALRLETALTELHARVAPAVVALLEFDPMSDAQAEAATGTIVSKDGYVVTAGHCIEWTGRKVDLRLADGRSVTATCLGKDSERDFGLLKIDDAGPFPSVGILPDVSKLVADEVVVMYGFPDGGEPGRAAVARLGTYLGVRSDGMIRTSCAMMPGDSGGPLFTLDGRIVGINSEIDAAINSNYHAQMAHVVRDWKRLLASEVWGADPFESEGEWSWSGDELEHSKPPLAGMSVKAVRLLPKGRAGLGTAFEDAGASVRASVIGVTSRTAGGARRRGTGVVVAAGGDATIQDPGMSDLVVTKSSLVGDDFVRVRAGDGTLMNASVVRRDRALDLALVRFEGQLPAQSFAAKGLSLKAVNTGGNLTSPATGTLVATVLRGTTGRSRTARNRVSRQLEGSMVGAGAHNARRRTWGMLGISLPEDRAGEPRATRVEADKPAGDAGMRVGDVIQRIGAMLTPTRVELRAALRATGPGDRVEIEVDRDGDRVRLDVTLGSSQELPYFASDPEHVAYQTRTSKRRGGFGPVFRHDARLRPAECGSPLIDLTGRIVGLNIARADRTGTLTLRASTVNRFIVDELAGD